MYFQEKMDQTAQKWEMKKGEIYEFVEIFEAESYHYEKGKRTQAYCLR